MLRIMNSETRQILICRVEESHRNFKNAKIVKNIAKNQLSDSSLHPDPPAERADKSGFRSECVTSLINLPYARFVTLFEIIFLCFIY